MKYLIVTTLSDLKIVNDVVESTLHLDRDHIVPRSQELILACEIVREVDTGLCLNKEATDHSFA